MPYYINDKQISLDDLAARIMESDLVPSRAVLRDNIDENFAKLKASGIQTLADLRKTVKNAKNIALVEQTGLGRDYLTLLRREVESYFSKAVSLRDFAWLEQSKIAQLAILGYKNTEQFFDAVEAAGGIQAFVPSATGLDKDFLDTLFMLSGLTRIQWVSPLFAKMLFEAGYPDAPSIAAADAESLCRAVEAINVQHGYFKGNIGLRDIMRLIKSSSYIS